MYIKILYAINFGMLETLKAISGSFWREILELLKDGIKTALKYQVVLI